MIIKDKVAVISPESVDLSSTRKRNHLVAALDPLGLDGFLINLLPDLNDAGDTSGLVRLACSAVPNPNILQSMGTLEAMAATRDLGMIAASLQRHNLSLASVPSLEPSLVALSRTTHEVPRDTVTSYGPRNPQDQRMRRFTRLPEEVVFIDNFREGMEGLDPCIEALCEAQTTSITNPNFAVLVTSARDHFRTMVDGMIRVRQVITPELFTYKLRPYFDPIMIDGNTYMAPGGAQMPVLLVDLLIHQISNPDYSLYLEDNLRYLPTDYRELAEKTRKQPALMSKFDNLTSSENTDWQISQSGRVLLDFITTIHKFRTPHKTTAQENMAIREQGAKGSGGYDTGILEILSQAILDSRRRLSVYEERL